MSNDQHGPAHSQPDRASPTPERRKPLVQGRTPERATRTKRGGTLVPAGLGKVRGMVGLGRPTSIEGLTPEAAGYARRNFRLGVSNGVLLGLVDGLISPTIVLALFINHLGAPNFMVGLLPAIVSGGWFLPQLFIASRVQGQRHVMYWYRRTAISRSICMAILSIAAFLLAEYPGILLAVFFLLYSVYSLSGGISGIPWLEMVSKMIAPRRRGTFFSLRSFWGSVLALLASGLLAAILSERLPGMTFPYNFAVLFCIVTLLVTAGYASWMAMREPTAVETAPPITIRALLRRGIELVRTEREYRAFMVVRILLALATISDPFYAVFAKTVLGAPVEIVGLYVAASSAASLASNFVWGPMGDRATNRTLMAATVVAVAVVPLSALLLPMLSAVAAPNVVSTLFALVFVFAGLAAGSARILNNNMLLSIAPAAERATYIGFLNTVLGLVTFVPPLGGALVDIVGFPALFAFSLLLAGGAMLATTRMSTKHVYETTT